MKQGLLETEPGGASVFCRRMFHAGKPLSAVCLHASELFGVHRFLSFPAGSPHWYKGHSSIPAQAFSRIQKLCAYMEENGDVI